MSDIKTDDKGIYLLGYRVATFDTEAPSTIQGKFGELLLSLQDTGLGLDDLMLRLHAESDHPNV